MKTNIKRLNQIHKKPVAITLLVLCLLSLSSFKNGKPGEKKSTVIRKGISIGGPFQMVSIDGNISMILTNEPAGTLMLEGNEKDLNKVKYMVKSNELVIDAHKKNSANELTVYLSAATLKSMLVSGDVFISSTDTIKTENLQIWLNGNINVKVKTTGKISIEAYDGYDLFWKSPLKPNKKSIFSTASDL
jgi:hypothetical protein